MSEIKKKELIGAVSFREGDRVEMTYASLLFDYHARPGDEGIIVAQEGGALGYGIYTDPAKKMVWVHWDSGVTEGVYKNDLIKVNKKSSKKLAYTSQEEIISKLPDDELYCIGIAVEEESYGEDYDTILNELESLMTELKPSVASFEGLAGLDGEVYGMTWEVENLDKDEMIKAINKLVYIGVFDGGGLAHDTVQNSIDIVIEPGSNYMTISEYLDTIEDKKVSGTKKEAGEEHTVTWDVSEFTDEELISEITPAEKNRAEEGNEVTFRDGTHTRIFVYKDGEWVRKSSKKQAQDLYTDMDEDPVEVSNFNTTDEEIIRLVEMDEEDLANKLRISVDAAENLQNIIHDSYF